MNAAPPPDLNCHVVDTTMFWSATGGGVRRYLQTKHAWLQRQPGWTHSIAVPLARTAPATPGVVRLPALPLPGGGGYRLPLRRAALAQMLGALRPGLIEAGDPYRLAWAAIDVAHRRGIPALAFCHSNIERLARLFAGARLAGAAGRAAVAYARHVYNEFDLVLAPSESMRRHLLGWGVERVACQPLGVDTVAFSPARANAAWRASLGFGAGTRLLVYAGRFAAEKNLDVLAAAVRQLGEPYVLLAIGAGPRPPHGDRVHRLPFVGGVAELATALSSADAFMHAGDQETFGLSALEAMACGTPVVARNTEGLAELVDASVGVAVDSGRPDAYAQAITALFAADRQALRAAARRRAERYGWERVLPLLLAHYSRLLRVDAAAPAPRQTRDARAALPLS